MLTESTEKEFYTIKEFSSYAGVPATALRHYDKSGVFPPAKRGVEFENGYRFYSARQITTVKMVRVLAELGIPLQTIKELEQDRSPEKLIRLLAVHKDFVENRANFWHEAHSVIDTITELLNESISAAVEEIAVKRLKEKRIIMGGLNDFHGEEGFVREYTRFCNAPHYPALNPSYPVGGYFNGIEDFLNRPSQPTSFFSLDPNGREKRDAGLYLVGYTRGYYGHCNDLPSRMAAFAKENGLEFTGPVYNLYLTDELSVFNPEDYLLKVSAAVRETRRISRKCANQGCFQK